MDNALTDSKYIPLEPYQAGATSTITTDVVDMEGFDAAEIRVILGTVTSGGSGTVKLQDGAAAALGDAADVKGSSQAWTDADSDMEIILDLVRPQNRYFRLVIARSAQATVISAVAVRLYQAKQKPTVQDDTLVAASQVMLSPAEGTA